MSRETKFRAWNGRMMSGGKSLAQISDLGLDRFLGGGVVMQFTGLTDKNGKAIYESDILRTPATYSEKKIKVVEWNKNVNGWNIQPEHDGHRPTESTKTNHEVIGNVWENPELLKP